MDSIKDDDLGLDDVECFKEFLKFKKSCALLKAKEAEIALENEIKLVGTIEAGSNPSPPGTSSPINLPPISAPEENGKEWTSNSDPAKKSAQEYNRQESSEEKRGSDGSSREPDRAERSRLEYDSRSRRNRSRSRDRDIYRQRRSRSRSRSPRGSVGRRESRDPRGRDARDPRMSRETRDPRLRYEYDPRYPHMSPRGRDGSPQKSFYYEERPVQNFGYPPPVQAMMPMAPHGPPVVPDWDLTARQHWAAPVPPVVTQPIMPIETPEEKARKLAIEKEALQQKQTFIAQREEYLKKRENLIKELGLLKNQRRELGNSKVPDVQKIIMENLKLQDEITAKVKSVDNVLDMLKGLIGDTPHSSSPGSSEKDKRKSRKRKRSKSGSRSDSDVENRSRSRKRDDDAMKKQSRERTFENEPQFNLVFYDPEVHWCRPCKAFPSTAKEYLLHLHSGPHKDMLKNRKLQDLPWHDGQEDMEPATIKGLETKRCPIKGLQFFEASTAWFCNLCKIWMGDLHCASLHLKSKEHNKNYEDYCVKNPKWEVTWLSDRGKAVLASGKKEDILLKRQLEEQLILQKKHEEELRQSLEAKNNLVMPLTLPTRPAPRIGKEKSKKKSKDKKKGKKKKKRSSSSGSDSDSSSTSSSSDSDGDKKKKKKKKKDKDKDMQFLTKSKWEKSDSNDDGETGNSNEIPHQQGVKEISFHLSDNWSNRRPPSPTHVPEKHTILIPESTKVLKINTKKEGPRRTSVTRDNSSASTLQVRGKEREGPADKNESQFDKQTTDAASKKKLPTTILPKSKFAFIGRMPFAKRTKENSENKSKEQDVPTPDPTPPPPPVISHKVYPVEGPPPVLTNKTKVEVAKDILTRSQTMIYHRQMMNEMVLMDPIMMDEDMEIDRPEPSPPQILMPPAPPMIRPVLPPEVTTNLGKSTMAIPLPKDFQDALSIIYPDDPNRIVNPPLPPVPPPPSARIPTPPQIEPPDREYTPPPPPLPEAPSTPSPPHSFELTSDRACVIPDESVVNDVSDVNDVDEMAMLGIDKEDMAAQKI